MSGRVLSKVPACSTKAGTDAFALSHRAGSSHVELKIKQVSRALRTPARHGSEVSTIARLSTQPLSTHQTLHAMAAAAFPWIPQMPQLFRRTSRSTRLTVAGQVCLEDVGRLFMLLDQAKVSIRAAADGYRRALRVAISDDIVPSRLASLLAQCRTEEPEIGIRLFLMPLKQQIRGLRDDLYDVGLAQSDEVGEGLLAEPLWCDPLAVVVPLRHPLLARSRIPLEYVLDYPLVLCHPEACEGCARQIGRILRSVADEPVVADRVFTHDTLLAFVAGGYGIGLTNRVHVKDGRHAGAVARPLTGRAVMLTTYILRPDREPSGPLRRFIKRATSERNSSKSGDAATS